MAEAFLRKYAGDRFEVYSAGLHPTELHPLMKKVMKEMGFDMSGHHSKDLVQFLGATHFAYLITVCGKADAECPIFPGASIRLHWPFDDPSEFEGTEEEKLAKFRRVRDQIMEKVRSWTKEVTSSDQT
jgi:arsenate reductase